MDYHQAFIIDFARRTRANLEYIEARKGKGDDVYEVTQLANSLLGLLIFPREHYMRRIPATPLSELVKQGWPAIWTIEGELPEETLSELMRYLRNAIAHCNVEFKADVDGEIRGLQIWNQQRGKTNWRAEMSIADLKAITLKFIELIETEENGQETAASSIPPHLK